MINYINYSRFIIYISNDEPVPPIVPVFLFHFLLAQIAFHVVWRVEQSMETIPESSHYWLLFSQFANCDNCDNCDNCVT